MRPSCFTRPTQALRKSPVELDNVALVPASLLPYKKEWQRIVNELPRGSMVVYLPSKTKQRRIVTRVASLLRGHGASVWVIDGTINSSNGNVFEFPEG